MSCSRGLPQASGLVARQKPTLQFEYEAAEAHKDTGKYSMAIKVVKNKETRKVEREKIMWEFIVVVRLLMNDDLKVISD